MTTDISSSPFISVSLKLIQGFPQFRNKQLLILVDDLTHWTYLYSVGNNGIDDQMMNMICQAIAYEIQQPARQASRSYIALNHMQQLLTVGKEKVVAKNRIMRDKLDDVERQLRSIPTASITYAQLYINSFQDPWLQMSPYEALRGYKCQAGVKEEPPMHQVRINIDVLAKRSAVNRYRKTRINALA
ncbi:hypothetical protein TRVA0_010S01574 [Trichomonascus vanleenenianus]|uniref:uncharacterized protein n=1 Tax=Trichomonascus vanleenenianus TaxID=2268995 RepID=UPI003ECB7813